MKIIFNKIVTNKDTLKISLDNGATSVEKTVSELLSNGYSFTEDDCLDLNNIQLGNSSTSKRKPSFTAEQNNTFKNIARYYAIASADLADYLSTLGDNTSDNPYKIKLLDLSSDSIGMLKNSNKFVSIKIDDSVNSIGKNAFRKCTNLTSITIPNSVTSIGYYAFGECTNLTSVIITNSVTSIGNGAFFGCTSLTSVTIPSSVTSIGEYAFSNCSFTSLTIPNSVTSIGNSAFEGCTDLTSITIPNSVTFIGYSAFRDCTNLTSIIIPNSVTSIRDYTFNECTNLTSVTIPSSVTSMGDATFFECTSLTTINYTGTEEQWNAISKASDWNDGVPSNCVINYNYQG